MQNTKKLNVNIKISVRMQKKIIHEFLKERAEYAAKLKNTKAEKEIKSIIEVERQRDQSIRVNKVLRPRHAGGPNNILIPAKRNLRGPVFTPAFATTIPPC